VVIQALHAADGYRRQQIPLPVKNGLVAWIPIVNLSSLAAEEAASQVSQLLKNGHDVSMLTVNVVHLAAGQQVPQLQKNGEAVSMLTASVSPLLSGQQAPQLLTFVTSKGIGSQSCLM
jgi:hypothetical protein